MRVVIAIDSYKGCLSSLQAGEAAALGIRRAMPEAETLVLPLADGGEGTTEALLSGLGGMAVSVRVSGPLGKAVEARYGLLADGCTAIMEMAQAAGLPLVPPEERNPLNTSSYGVGEMIKDAIDRGCRQFFIGIGGSATNDGGLGMLSALGAAFFDAGGKPVGTAGRHLEEIAAADFSALDPRLQSCNFHIACDVNNPLCGPRGASAVFGPQKGADPAAVERLDRALANYARILSAAGGRDAADIPGAGAAGGLGFAFLQLPRAELIPGARLVCEVTGLKEAIADADLVITGEGRIDAQTAMGKGPGMVASLAAEYARPVIAFAGSVSDSAAVCHQHGIHAIFPIQKGPSTLEEAMDSAAAEKNLQRTAEEVFRLIAAIRGS